MAVVKMCDYLYICFPAKSAVRNRSWRNSENFRLRETSRPIFGVISPSSAAQLVVGEASPRATAGGIVGLRGSEKNDGLNTAGCFFIHRIHFFVIMDVLYFL